MLIIKHRLNTIKKLENLKHDYGAEIDIRSYNREIIISHDPFKKGETLNNWIKYFKHKMLVLNVKEEGLENRIINILKKNKIKNFFFHDQSFSSMLKNMHKTKVSIRYSEYEDLKKKDKLFNKIKWIWIDNFSEIKIDKKFYFFLKKKNVRICFVSPELVNKSREKEIKKIISFLKNKKFKIDAVCTKKPNLWSNF